jgi:hypothetical protein
LKRTLRTPCHFHDFAQPLGKTLNEEALGLFNGL